MAPTIKEPKMSADTIPKTNHLLALPPEVRNMIYRYVYFSDHDGPTKQIVLDRWTVDPHNGSGPRSGIVIIDRLLRNPRLGLLLSCRQIHQEAPAQTHDIELVVTHAVHLRDPLASYVERIPAAERDLVTSVVYTRCGQDLEPVTRGMFANLCRVQIAHLVQHLDGQTADGWDGGPGLPATLGRDLKAYAEERVWYERRLRPFVRKTGCEVTIKGWFVDKRGRSTSGMEVVVDVKHDWEVTSASFNTYMKVLQGESDQRKLRTKWWDDPRAYRCVGSGPRQPKMFDINDCLVWP